MSEREYQPLYSSLVRAQKERPRRQEWEDGEVGWMRHERLVMLAAVNALRAKKGRLPVEMADVAAAERQACGHFDYTMKYALGCEALVLSP